MTAGAACGSPTAPENAPGTHTDFKGGAAHAPGAGDATVNCVACHGADLRGGTNGEPSCRKKSAEDIGQHCRPIRSRPPRMRHCIKRNRNHRHLRAKVERIRDCGLG